MHQKYIFAALGSYIVWGFVPIMFKQLSDYNPYEIATFRMIIASIVMFLILLPNRKMHQQNFKELHEQSKRQRLKTIVLTVLGAVLLSANWLTYIYVINDVSVHAGAFAYLILPIVTAFLAFLILREELSPMKWLGILLGTLSCFLKANIDVSQLYVISIVTLSYSFYMISQKANTLFNRRLLLTCQMVIGSVFLGTINTVTIVDKPIEFWFWVTLVSVFFTILPLLLNLYALSKLQSSQLAFMIYLNPIISFLIGWFLYDERLTALEIGSFVLLFFAILSFNWSLIKSVILPRFRKNFI